MFQRTSVIDMPGTDMDRRSIYDIDRSPFSFTGMASTYAIGEDAGYSDGEVLHDYESTTSYKLFRRIFASFFGVALFVLTTLIFAPETILIPASPE